MAEVITAKSLKGSRYENARRNAVRSSGGATEVGYSAALKRSLLPYEQRQRYEENEALAAYDDKGNQLARIQGDNDSVRIRKEDIPSENLILTHNHPWALAQNGYMRIGSSFSMDDALIAVKYNAKEIRAVTPTYTFSIKRRGNKWNTTQADVRRAYMRAQAQVVSDGQDYSARVGYSGTVNNRYTITYWHKVNKLVAKELGWNYTKKNR